MWQKLRLLENQITPNFATFIRLYNLLHLEKNLYSIWNFKNAHFLFFNSQNCTFFWPHTIQTSRNWLPPIVCLAVGCCQKQSFNDFFSKIGFISLGCKCVCSTFGPCTHPMPNEKSVVKASICSEVLNASMFVPSGSSTSSLEPNGYLYVRFGFVKRGIFRG